MIFNRFHLILAILLQGSNHQCLSSDTAPTNVLGTADSGLVNSDKGVSDTGEIMIDDPDQGVPDTGEIMIDDPDQGVPDTGEIMIDDPDQIVPDTGEIMIDDPNRELLDTGDIIIDDLDKGEADTGHIEIDDGSQIDIEISEKKPCKILLDESVKQQVEEGKQIRRINVSFNFKKKETCLLEIEKTIELPDLKRIVFSESKKPVNLTIEESNLDQIFEMISVKKGSMVEILEIDLDLDIDRDLIAIEAKATKKYKSNLKATKGIKTKILRQIVDAKTIEFGFGKLKDFPESYTYELLNSVENIKMKHFNIQAKEPESKLTLMMCDISKYKDKFKNVFNLVGKSKLCRQFAEVEAPITSAQLVCPKGMFFSENALNIKAFHQLQCFPCGIGHYKDEEANSDCKKCPANSSTEFKGSTNRGSCKCLPGFERQGDSCIACRDGTFKQNLGDTSCNDCGINRKTFSTAMFTPEGCGCKEGMENVSGKCTFCPIGTFKDFTSNHIKCLSCGEHSTTLGRGSKTKDDCVCQKGYQKIDGICVPCPLGFIKCSEFAEMCYACPANMTTSNPGSNNIIDCKCIEGYMPVFDKKETSCVLVPIGFYKDKAENRLPFRCPKNQTTLAAGSTTTESCICSPGFFDAGGGKLKNNMTDCQPCPIGKYKPTSEVDSCISCPPNMTTKTSGTIAHSSCICKQGFVEKVSAGFTTCVPYNPEEESDLDDNFSKDKRDQNKYLELSVEQSPETCVKGQEMTDGVCKECSSGYYREESSVDTCIPCGENQTSFEIGSATPTDCLCAYRYKSNNEELHGTECIPVNKNYYKDEIGNDNSKPCPNNMITFGVGNVDISDCQCNLGYEPSPVSESLGCVPCQKGFFRESFQYSVCTKCPEFTTTLREATKRKDDCQCIDGYEISLETDTCVESRLGYYKTEVGNTRSMSCPPYSVTPSVGSLVEDMCICIAGYEYLNNQCIACQDGFYKESLGNHLCTPCGWQLSTKGRLGSYNKEIHCKVECDIRYYTKEEIGGQEMCAIKTHLLAIFLVTILVIIVCLSILIYVFTAKASKDKRRANKFNAFLNRTSVDPETTNLIGNELDGDKSEGKNSDPDFAANQIGMQDYDSANQGEDD
ncbi:MAG: hypothetical protein MHMPM18_000569 [Marteilia pararefringens]